MTPKGQSPQVGRGGASGPATQPSVFGTHITMSDSHVGHIDVIWSSEAQARKHALQCSTHPGVLYASVTVFTLNELGTRTPLVWYIHGRENVNGRPFATGRYGPVISRHNHDDAH